MFWRIVVTKLLLVSLDFRSMEKKYYGISGDQKPLNILKNIFCCVHQKKRNWSLLQILHLQGSQHNTNLKVSGMWPSVDVVCVCVCVCACEREGFIASH